MRFPALAVILALSMFGCDSKTSASESAPPTASKPDSARVPLVDLTASSTLAAVRTAFNAHKGEARFLTLLSPT
jgi:hypothetical protein